MPCRGTEKRNRALVCGGRMQLRGGAFRCHQSKAYFAIWKPVWIPANCCETWNSWPRMWANGASGKWPPH